MTCFFLLLEKTTSMGAPAGCPDKQVNRFDHYYDYILEILCCFLSETEALLSIRTRYGQLLDQVLIKKW